MAVQLQVESELLSTEEIAQGTHGQARLVPNGACSMALISEACGMSDKGQMLVIPNHAPDGAGGKALTTEYARRHTVIAAEHAREMHAVAACPIRDLAYPFPWYVDQALADLLEPLRRS
jgi:hypothetical protein